MNQIPDYYFLPDNVTGNLILDDKLDFDRYSVNCILRENPIIRAFQDHPKSYVEWAITQIPPVSRTIRDRDPQYARSGGHRTCVRGHEGPL